MTGLSTFFGDGFVPFRLVFFAGVAALGVTAFLPLRVDLALGVAGTGEEASIFSELAVFAGEATLAGDLAPRFPRVAFLAGVTAFGVAIFLPLRVVFAFSVTVSGDDSGCFTGLSTLAFFAGETFFIGDLPRFTRAAFGVASLAGVGALGWPLVDLPFTGLAALAGDALGVATFGLPRVDLPFVFLGVAAFTIAGAGVRSDSDSFALGVATSGLPRVDRLFAFGVFTFLTGDAALAFPLVDLEGLGVVGSGDKTFSGELVTLTGDAAFFPRAERPLGVEGFTGDDTTFFPLVALPFFADGFGDDTGNAALCTEAAAAFLPLVALPYLWRWGFRRHWLCPPDWRR